MNLEARKLSFIQEFLRLQNEEIVSGLENFLRKRNSLMKIIYLVFIDKIENSIPSFDFQ